jgi:hypothetical protein
LKLIILQHCSKSSETRFTLDGTDSKVIRHNLKIFNYGPSSIEQLSIEMLVPVAMTRKGKKIKIIEVLNDEEPEENLAHDMPKTNDVDDDFEGFEEKQEKCENSTHIAVKTDENVSKLKKSETIFFDCSQDFVEYETRKLFKSDIKADGNAIEVTMDLAVDLEKLGKFSMHF